MSQRSGEMQQRCAEIKIRAERRAGELLREMPKNPGGKSTKPTMGSVGIEHHQALRWQTIAVLPTPDFEAQIAETKAQGKELTSAVVVYQ